MLVPSTLLGKVLIDHFLHPGVNLLERGTSSRDLGTAVEIGFWVLNCDSKVSRRGTNTQKHKRCPENNENNENT